MDVILCGNRKKRTVRPNLIVGHVNVGPEVEGGAQSLANWLRDKQQGYHLVADDTEVIRTAWDDEIVAGAGGVNTRSLHWCIIGRPEQTAAEWADRYSSAAMRNLAPYVRAWHSAFSIPVAKITAAAMYAGGSGEVAHADVSVYYWQSAGHWDPGPQFPWATFIDLVAGASRPSPDRRARRVLIQGSQQPAVYIVADDCSGTKWWIDSPSMLDYTKQHLAASGHDVTVYVREQAFVDRIPLAGPEPKGYKGARVEQHPVGGLTA